MRGVRAAHCENHLHQLHVCLPAGPGRTRLLYRMSMDFLAWTRHVPLIKRFWASIAGQVRLPCQARLQPAAAALPCLPAAAATSLGARWRAGQCLHAWGPGAGSCRAATRWR